MSFSKRRSDEDDPSYLYLRSRTRSYTPQCPLELFVQQLKHRTPLHDVDNWSDVHILLLASCMCGAEADDFEGLLVRLAEAPKTNGCTPLE